MKSKLSIRLVVSTLSVHLLTPATAEDYYWDANGASGGTGGTGNWNTTGSLWRTPTSEDSLTTWTNGNSAVLGGAYGTLSTTAAITVNGVRVDSTASGTAPYIIQNGTGGSFGFTGTGITIDVAPGKSLRFTQSGTSGGGAAGISGTGAVTVQGGGTLTMSGTNRVYGGSFVVTGTGTTVLFSNTNGLDNGSSSTGLNVRNDAVLEITGTNNYRTGMSLGASGASGGTLKLGHNNALVFQNGSSLGVSGTSKSTILSTLANTGTATANFGSITGNGGTRTVTINPTGDASGVDLEYSAGWRNGTMVKAGGGVMRLNPGFYLNRASDFTTFNNTGVALRVNAGTFVNEGTVKSITEVNGGTLRTGPSSGSFDQVDLLAGVFEISRESGVFTDGLTYATGKNAINLNGGTLRYVGIATDFSPLFGELGAGGGSIDTNGQNVTLASGIAGGGGLAKLGSGTLTLAGANHTYTGATHVTAGTLLVTGALGATAVTVAADAMIGGSGSLGGDLTLSAGAKFRFDPLATLTVSAGTVSFGGFGIGDLVGLDGSVAEAAYTLIQDTGTAVIDFTHVGNLGIANAAPIGGGKFAYLEQGSLRVVVIPEPSALWLGGLGLLAVACRRRR